MKNDYPTFAFTTHDIVSLGDPGTFHDALRICYLLQAKIVYTQTHVMVTAIVRYLGTPEVAQIDIAVTANADNALTAIYTAVRKMYEKFQTNPNAEIIKRNTA
jgi:hypothetical protein